jgi:hypothetical protein
VAKRTRASRSARRPGGQGPSRTKKTSEAGTSPAIPTEPEVSGAEEIGASYQEVEVDEVAAAAVAATAKTPRSEDEVTGRRARRRARGRTAKKRSQQDLASRAAAETAWVREDLRRIGVVSVVLLAALAIAYVVFGVMDVLSLY